MTGQDESSDGSYALPTPDGYAPPGGSLPPPPDAYPPPGGYPPPPGSYPPQPADLPPCYRCGAPAAAHAGGMCPAPPIARLTRTGSPAAVAFGALAGIAAVLAALIWVFTASSAQACTVTGQLEGQTCYPALQTAHTVSGPGVIALGVVALILIVTDRR